METARRRSLANLRTNNLQIRKFILKAVPNAYLLGVLLMLTAVGLYVGSGFHEWHNSHLTPHMLGVSLNLHTSHLLCNSIAESCESYHRHPPLYFYLNYILATFSSSSEQYFRYAMTFSIVMNYVGIILMMKVFGESNQERILFLAIFSSSFLFLANLTLSNYESLFLIIFAAYSLSLKYNRPWCGYAGVFFGSILSWFTVLASIMFVLIELQKRNFRVLLPFAGGITITIGYLFLGIDQFSENFQGVAKNIEFSGSVPDGRQYDLNEVARMLLGTLKHLIFPSFVFILLGCFSSNYRRALRIKHVPIYALLPTFVVCAWSVVFFSWSIVHNFVYISLLISAGWFGVHLYRTYSTRAQIMVVLSLALLIPYQHFAVAEGYNPLGQYDNVGVRILEEAITSYGNFDH